MTNLWFGAFSIATKWIFQKKEKNEYERINGLHAIFIGIVFAWFLLVFSLIFSFAISLCILTIFYLLLLIFREFEIVSKGDQQS